ncbi:hypothetical protein [Thermococcus sp. GR6]|nr:hypothetical protein [Thermococcus sp. GR6]
MKWEELSFGDAKKELEWLSKKAEAAENKRRIHLVLELRRRLKVKKGYVV